MTRKLRWPWGFVAALALILSGVAVVISSTGSTKASIGVPNALREAGNASHEAKFNRGQGKEANRERPSTPAQEQVANRAYPRGYVDDRLALKEFKRFGSLPRGRAAANVRGSAIAPAAGTGPWTERGPFTPNVAGPDPPFFDTTALTGP